MTIRDEFIEFCRMKSGSYEYYDSRNCPLAQFGQSRHPGANVRGSAAAYTVDDQLGERRTEVFDDEYDMVRLCRAHTWEDLVFRLENHI